MKSHTKVREEARRLFLTGEVETNAEIAARLAVKPHTVGRWRREEDWDGLRHKIERHSAEKFVEKVATDRVTLNLRHYRYWDIVLTSLAEVLKNAGSLDIRDLERAAGILERAQKGQRLAKGLSLSGETEETIRAQSMSEIRRLIDVFIDSVKEHVSDEETRECIRQAIIGAIPPEEGTGTGDAGDEVTQ